MNLATVAVKNITRNRFRALLTIAGVAVAILTFVLLRTVIWSWTAAVEQSATDRIGIRHKVTFIMPLPKKYIEEVRQIPGVTAAAYANWFGAKDPNHETEFFGTIAVEPDEVLKVYDEVKVKPDELEAWKQNRRGALVGDALAKKLGWKVGQNVTLRGTIYPGDWQFQISGIYTATRASVDRSTFYFHWKYLNESLPPARQDKIGWVVARINEPGRSAEICRAVDAKFDDRDVQTLCMSERAMQASFLGMMSAVLKAIDIVSIVILLIMTLVIGNTIAMGVRERTTEYGTLRAIGFVPKHIVLFVLGESLVTGAIGGALGLLLAYPIVEKGLGRFLEENMGAFFPFFRIQPQTALVAFLAALALSAVAAALPAYGTTRLKTVDALRRVG
ncbi:MAG TPA: FtsX-like permease family protein [Polyangiaceae bacterium]|nr:FtsX-like permease family protein [Polyangiaceae bacterium]